MSKPASATPEDLQDALDSLADRQEGLSAIMAKLKSGDDFVSRRFRAIAASICDLLSDAGSGYDEQSAVAIMMMVHVYMQDSGEAWADYTENVAPVVSDRARR